MKRMLCIVGSMNAGGAETFLMKVYRELDKTQYQMDFAVAAEEKGFYDDEILSMGGRIHHIVPKTKGVVKNFLSVKALVAGEGYSYVLRTSQHSLSALELLAARLGGATTTIYRSSNSNTGSLSRVQSVMHSLCRFMPRRFANVRIAPSTEAAEFMFGKDFVKKNKCSLIHNAIDTDVYHYSTEWRKEIREELNLTNKTVIGHVGRFTHQKNHTFLLDVFCEIKKRDPDAVLVLVGKGELESEIEEKAQSLGIFKDIVFTGVRSDVPHLLCAMDVFVFPSFYEGMPNTVIEAQATGLPCVIADTITKEANITGLVQYLPLKDPAYWAERSLAAISSERADTKALFMENKYDIQSVAEEFVKLMNED